MATYRNAYVLKRALSRINSSNNNTKSELPPLKSRAYNCWGFTAYIFGWIRDYSWLSCYQMEDLLEEFSVPVDNPQVGDIAVFRDEDDKLEHTAIITDKKVKHILHKPGGWDLEKTSIKHVEESSVYNYGVVTEYRRSIK